MTFQLHIAKGTGTWTLFWIVYPNLKSCHSGRFSEVFKNIILCIVVQLDYFVNLFPLQLVKVSGSRGALVGLELEVGGDEGDGGGGGKRDNVRGEEAVVDQIFVVVVFVRVLVGIVVVIVVVVFRGSG